MSGNYRTLEEMADELQHGEYHYYNKKNNNEEFMEHLDLISHRNILSNLCNDSITKDYYDNYMYPYVKDIFLLKQRYRNGRKGIVMAVLGRPIRKRGIKYYYIDLLCSSNKIENKPKYFGQDFLNLVIEKLKTNEYGSHTQFALRASLPRLISYYKKSGFKRSKNACNPRFKTLPENKEFQALEGYDLLKFDGTDLRTNRYIPTQLEKQRMKRLVSQRRRRRTGSSKSYRSSKPNNPRGPLTQEQLRERRKLMNKPTKECDYIQEAINSKNNPDHYPECFLRDGWWMSKC